MSVQLLGAPNTPEERYLRDNEYQIQTTAQDRLGNDVEGFIFWLNRIIAMLIVKYGELYNADAATIAQIFQQKIRENSVPAYDIALLNCEQLNLLRLTCSNINERALKVELLTRYSELVNDAIYCTTLQRKKLALARIALAVQTELQAVLPPAPPPAPVRRIPPLLAAIQGQQGGTLITGRRRRNQLISIVNNTDSPQERFANRGNRAPAFAAATYTSDDFQLHLNHARPCANAVQQLAGYFHRMDNEEEAAGILRELPFMSQLYLYEKMPPRSPKINLIVDIMVDFFYDLGECEAPVNANQSIMLTAAEHKAVMIHYLQTHQDDQIVGARYENILNAIVEAEQR